MANGILGLTRPQMGNRDRAGMAAFRLNSARERLTKGGAKLRDLSVQDLEVEANRHDAEQLQRRRDHDAQVAAEAQDRQALKRGFMTAVRAAEPGDEIGPDVDGHFWLLDESGDLIDLGIQP